MTSDADIWTLKGVLTLAEDRVDDTSGVVLPPLSGQDEDTQPLPALLTRYRSASTAAREKCSLQLENGQTYNDRDIEALLARPDCPVGPTDERGDLADRSTRQVPTDMQQKPNLSTENQPEGAGRRPSDTLDREPKRDPYSGASIPSDYDPLTQTRVGEAEDSRAGREGAGRR